MLATKRPVWAGFGVAVALGVAALALAAYQWWSTERWFAVDERAVTLGYSRGKLRIGWDMIDELWIREVTFRGRLPVAIKRRFLVVAPARAQTTPRRRKLVLPLVRDGLALVDIGVWTVDETMIVQVLRRFGGDRFQNDPNPPAY